MLTDSESAVMDVFREFLVGPGEMVCFPTPLAEKHAASLKRLTQRDYLTKEEFAAGYSLTAAGYRAMRTKRK
ncbi:MAG: hypothetical protein CMJ58_27195 [Planctomycetaceae bacterium]|nr:hypothetical protein [Planctomycetaceae bacterium]